MIVGVDEVGRGCWAGPLCVAAVAWPNITLSGLRDSKQVSAAKRPGLSLAVRKLSPSLGLGWVSAAEVDRIGLTAALRRAANTALSQIQLEFDEIIVDGNLELISDQRAVHLPKADATIPAVMAASVVAKVARDRYMQVLGASYRQYQFEKHVGYGTALHRQLLEQFGPSPQHRMSFKPLKDMIV